MKCCIVSTLCCWQDRASGAHAEFCEGPTFFFFFASGNFKKGGATSFATCLAFFLFLNIEVPGV